MDKYFRDVPSDIYEFSVFLVAVTVRDERCDAAILRRDHLTNQSPANKSARWKLFKGSCLKMEGMEVVKEDFK